MAVLRLEYLSDAQRDAWLDHVLPLIAGRITDRREADKILHEARKKRMAEATEKVRAKYPDKTEDEIESLLWAPSYDLVKMGKVILYQLYPYTPQREPGVVPPKGGPFDKTAEERLRSDLYGMGQKISEGQITIDAFDGNRKKVTVSVEGFDHPLKLKTTFFPDKKYGRGFVTGDIIVEDMSYSFQPATNDRGAMTTYGDARMIDEGKRWTLLSKSPLDDWQIRRREAQKKRRQTQLTKTEKAYLDEQILGVIQKWGEDRETRYENERKHWVEWRGWVPANHRRGPAITVKNIQLSWYGKDWEWPEEPSEAAQGAYGDPDDGYDGMRKSVVVNSLNRLLRKKLISKYSEERGKPAEYWIREQDND
jgi:hypothetical protein